MAWAGMVRVRAGVGGMGKSAVTSVVSPESSFCAPPAGWATRVVSSATSIATVETGRILGRVAESSSGDDASAGADIGAPQLGHAIAVPDARAVRRPQRAHAISCILLLQRMKAGETRASVVLTLSNEQRHVARSASVCPTRAWRASRRRWRGLALLGVSRPNQRVEQRADPDGQ